MIRTILAVTLFSAPAAAQTLTIAALPPGVDHVSYPLYTAAPVAQIPGCGGGASVFWSSEGTAWDAPRADVWVTVFNPSEAAQSARLRVFPDDDGHTPTALGQTVAVPAKRRVAVYVNAWLKANDLQGNRNVALEVQCSGVCAVAIATWTGNYAHVAYNPLTAACAVDPLANPYVPE